MSKWILHLLLAVSLGLNVGVIAMTLLHRSDGPPPGPRPEPVKHGGPLPGQRPDPAWLVENHVQGMTRHLNLDAEQQQAIRAVLERHATELTTLQVAAAEAGRRLADAFAAPTLDPENFQRLTAETSVARSRLDSLSAVMVVAEAAVLTLEQRQKFAEVAPTIHSQPQRPPHEGRPPPR